MSAPSPEKPELAPLEGAERLIGAVALSVGTFMTILDTSVTNVSVPTIIQGAASAMFFMPLTSLLLSGIPPERVPSAAGLSNFVRYSAGAFGASVSITLWDERTALHRAHLVEHATAYDSTTGAALEDFQAHGFTPDPALGMLDRAIEPQARMTGTNDLFWIAGVMFLALAVLVWIARPPPRPQAASSRNADDHS